MVINADDFGMTQGVNKACLELYLDGKLDSVSVMVNQEFTDEAIELIKEHGIKCGLHFNITQGKSLTGCIEGVTDAEGNFLGNKAVDFGKVPKYDIIGEFIAQYELLSKEVDVEFVDCHHNINFYLKDTFLEDIVKSMGLTIRDGEGSCDIQDILPGKEYEVVFCHPAYLDELLLELSPKYYHRRLVEYTYLKSGGYETVKEGLYVV